MDDRRAWSIVCFYLDRGLRGQGLAVAFLRAAMQHAADQGAEVLEGYPVEPEVDEAGNRRPAKSYRFMGYRSTFERAGFLDASPAGSKRLVMRFMIEAGENAE